MQNQNGFSLVQIMIAAAVMAGLSVLFMQMMSNQNMQQKTAVAQGEITSVSTTISSILANNVQCTANFQGTFPPSSPFPGLKLGKNDTDYAVAVGQAIGNISIKSMEFTAPPSLSDGKGLVSVDVMFDKEKGAADDAKRTTQGPRYVTKQFTFMAQFGDQIMLGGEPGDGGYFCSDGTDKSAALQICNSTLDAEEDGTSTCNTLTGGSDDCICDDDDNYAYYVDGEDGNEGKKCWRFLVIYNTEDTNKIAKCSN